MWGNPEFQIFQIFIKISMQMEAFIDPPPPPPPPPPNRIKDD